ncbi:MAG: type II toxin-antitoxin system Phd/YefM family antitoxin [Candidatus Margulisbacteria bacterium]|jgi:prevent-host-death family protein|nr:type II toxin-antitoxin system Phd/YefM family antitoxin [Candidatus Margulisiibacteriota bacterium]
MRNTHIRPVRDLRNNYAEVAALLKNHDQVIITKNGRGAAVLINYTDYPEIEEYLHYKYMLEKLNEAEEEAASPKVEWLDHKTVFCALRKKYHEETI